MQLQEAKKPITVVSQVFGLAPLFWSKFGDISVPLSLLLLTLCVVSNAMFIMDLRVISNHTLPMYVLIVTVTGISTSHVLQRIAYLRNRNYLAGLLSRLQLMQMSLGENWEYRSAYWFSVVLLLISGSVIASYNILRWYTSHGGVCAISNYLSSFTVYMVEMQFIGIVHVLYQLFKQVNEALSRNRKDVRYLMNVHGQLCDVAQEITKEFSVPMVVNLIFAFTALVTSLYFALQGLLQGGSASKDIWVLSYISWYWPLVGIPSLWFKIRTCHLAANEANRTAVLVHKRLIDEKEIHVRCELVMFSLQLLHRKLHFTAGGFVIMDLTLLQSMASAVTTYLIILIQFQLFL